MKDSLKQTLAALVALPGVAGFEQEVVKAVAASLTRFADHVDIDNFGNIYALKEGRSPGPSLAIFSHSDAVGAIVNEVLPSGLLGFRPVGVVSESVLPATRVCVKGINGVIGAAPAHLEVGASGNQGGSRSGLHIDIGATSDAQVRGWGIEVGTPVSFVGELTELGNPDRLYGPSLDDRIGCAIVIELFQELANAQFAGKVYGVVTVQEETTMSGARIAGARLQPDCAIAVDTVPANDTTAGGSAKFTIGGGPVIQLAEGVRGAFVGTVAHPAVKSAILGVAGEQGIKVQLAAEIGNWTTDASAIHVAGKGIPTGFISIPRRYAHSPVEVMDINDAVSAVHLLKGVINGLGGLDLRFVRL